MECDEETTANRPLRGGFISHNFQTRIKIGLKPDFARLVERI
jgi:hypothetical protein